MDLSVIGREFKAIKHPYLWRDVVIYHLGIGARANELPYVFEGAPGGMKVLPTFAMVPAMEAASTILAYARVDFVNLLHGEQTIKMHAPIPARGVFMTTPKVADIRDTTVCRGAIGFQVHAGEQFTGMKIIVKEARVRALDKPAP